MARGSLPPLDGTLKMQRGYLEVIERKDRRIEDLEEGIRMALRILHRTSVSKKETADHLRALIGMEPGERMTTEGE